MIAYRGLTSIVALSALCAALVVWNISDLFHAVKARTAAQTADSNLNQAEGMLKACFQHAVFIVGTDIYRCKATKSELTTAQVPEAKEVL